MPQLGSLASWGWLSTDAWLRHALGTSRSAAWGPMCAEGCAAVARPGREARPTPPSLRRWTRRCDKAPAEEAPFYIGAQLAGATVAAAVNYLVF